jgi:REP element-mobilizing transposase RayT
MERLERRLKIHLPNTIYHVIIRGNDRQEIFFSQEYHERFIKILDDASEKFDHRILTYCLMTNHIHLVVAIHKTKLSEVMQNINYRYARWVNKKRSRIGHLFQGRYRAIQVEDEMYLINLCK